MAPTGAPPTDLPHPLTDVPQGPVHRWAKPVVRFLEIEAAGGAVLLLTAVVALLLANSESADLYHSVRDFPVAFSIGDLTLSHTLEEWINQGLMTIFFFVVGLEIKREILFGELQDPRKAALPIAGAIGGMIVPAGIYLSLQLGEPGQHGWGIPMATDIAFAVGCLAILGNRVPHGLKIFVLALAIADDIGAILVIAFGYSSGISFEALALAALGLAVVVLMQRIAVRWVSAYVIVGIGIWLAFVESGVHSTVSGVILGLMTPGTAWVGDERFREMVDRASHYLEKTGPGRPPDHHEVLRQVALTARENVAPLNRLENALHPWVAFGIMPLFAFANSGVAVTLGSIEHPVALAVMAGLLFGKPIGIVAVSVLSVHLGFARLPDGVTWPAMVGAGFIAGIGFTVALFLAHLALAGELLDAAKIGILTGSAISAVVGLLLLGGLLRRVAVTPLTGAEEAP